MRRTQVVGATMATALAVSFLVGAAGPVGAATGPVTHPARACASLVGTGIPAAAISLRTTGGVVTAAAAVAASGAGPTSVGAYCLASASLRPVDRTAPEIRLQVALPDDWNTKALMFGGGGYDGTIPAVTGNVPFGPADELTPLGRGFATFASDSGHQATPGFQPTASLDGSFLSNAEALHNFSGDALKKTHDAARYLLHSYYDGTPSRTYFAGGSTGGREALAVAQRWPRTFDGVISAYPAYNAATLDLYFGYITRQFVRPGAFPRPAQQALLYNAVIANCDQLDGAADGIVSERAGCNFDPVVLRCPDGADTGDTCLSDAQIAAIRAVSRGITFPYPLASGEKGYPGFPFLDGARMDTTLLGMGTTPPDSPMPITAGYGEQFWDQWVRFAVTHDPSYDSTTLDPLNPGKWQQRISRLTALQDVNNPDLRPFADSGGKLLLVHGTADELVSHRSTVDYYQRMVSTMGPQQVRAFSRFYLVPGANHANVGATFQAGWDSLTALDRWVTEGRAPVNQIVRDKRTDVSRARPLCEYPTYPRYNGTGSVDFASSFTCVRSAWGDAA